MVMMMKTCEICDREIKSSFDTPKYGCLCLMCWCEKMGEIVEEYPIVGIDDECDLSS